MNKNKREGTPVVYVVYVVYVRCVEIAALGRVRLCCTSGVKVLAWLRLGPMLG